jgi:hypothetical protein
MANVTENRRQGCGNITIDTEVTSGGKYPVEGKGIYSAIGAVTLTAGTGISISSKKINIDTTGATTGQFLKKTSDGVAFGDITAAAAVTPVDTGDDATAAANASAINDIISALQAAGLMETPTP